MLVFIGLMFFVFMIILGWNYYGECCMVFLFGIKVVLFYKIVFIGLIVLGVFLYFDLIWIIVDIVNGLMVILNFIGFVVLCYVVVEEMK